MNNYSEKAGLPEGSPAQNLGVNNKCPGVKSLDELALNAEYQAELLLYAWAEHGTDGCHLAPELFPTDRHKEAAELIIEATSEGDRGWGMIASRLSHSIQKTQAFTALFESKPWPKTKEGAWRLANELHQYHFERKRVEIGQSISRKLEEGFNPDQELEELQRINEEAKSIGGQSLIDKAYAMRYDPANVPPADEVCITLGDTPIAARGNLSVIQGKSKVGKTAVSGSTLGAAHRSTYSAYGDTLCMDWVGGDTEGAIIHLDTEQSHGDWHAQATRAVTRSGLDWHERFVSLPLVLFKRSERTAILREAMERESKKEGGIDLVLIDGIADLCTSPNDEKESLELVSQVHALAQKYTCPIVCVLHENPSSDTSAPKTRGHLGSELNRKAFANLRCDKDNETGISTLYGTEMRKGDIPKEYGFCFGWDNEAGMHTFKGRANGIKAAKIERSKRQENYDYFEPLYEEFGTLSSCPDCSPDDLLSLDWDNDGTKKKPKKEALKKRMQRAEAIGVLRKTTQGRWALNHSGHFGT